MGSHAYATTNLLTGVGASAFVWSNAYAAADRILVNDGRMDKRLVVGDLDLLAGPTSYVRIDLGASYEVRGVAILNHNLGVISTSVATNGARVTIRGATDHAITTSVVTAKAASTIGSHLSRNSREPMNKDHVFQFAPVTKRYWEIAFDYDGSGTGIAPSAAFGEIFIYSSVTQLTRKSIYGSGDAREMYTSELRFGNGETRGLFQGGPCRTKTLRWQDLDDDERDELRVMWLSASGNAGRLLFINSYEATATAAAATEQDCIFGRLTGLDAVEFNEMDFGLFGFSDLTVRSLGREVGA